MKVRMPFTLSVFTFLRRWAMWPKGKSVGGTHASARRASGSDEQKESAIEAGGLRTGAVYGAPSLRHKAFTASRSSGRFRAYARFASR